jgi:hypothetical protein
MDGSRKQTICGSRGGVFQLSHWTNFPEAGQQIAQRDRLNQKQPNLASRKFFDGLLKKPETIGAMLHHRGVL